MKSKYRKDLPKVLVLIMLGIITFASVYTIRTRLHPPSPIVFNLISLDFKTDSYASLQLEYLTTGSCTAALLTPSGAEVVSILLQPGHSIVELPLTEGLETLREPYYVLRVKGGGQILYESFLNRPMILYEYRTTKWGWNPIENKNTIRAFEARLSNVGDLPVFVQKIRVRVGSVNLGEYPVERWIMPGKQHTLSYSTWSESLEHPKTYSVTIEALDIDNEKIEPPLGRRTLSLTAPPGKPVYYWERIEQWNGIAENHFGVEHWKGIIRAPVRWEVATRWWIRG